MARVNRDDVDRWYQFGLLPAARTLYIGTDHADGDVDHRMAEFAIKGLQILDATEGEITIKLYTPGGDWYAGMAIYDAIRTCNNEVRILGYGQLVSMGVIILQAADQRLLMPHCRVMFHYGEIEMPADHALNIAALERENAATRAVYEAIMIERMQAKDPGMSVAKFRSRFSFDTWMGPREAIDLGLADGIWEG